VHCKPCLCEHFFVINQVSSGGTKSSSTIRVRPSFSLPILIRLTGDSFISLLLKKLPLKRVFTYEQIDSTNAEAMRMLRNGQTCPFLVLAQEQLAGKGRRGRKWESPLDAGLYYSLTLELTKEVSNIAALSLVAALGVCDALEGIGVRGLGLKWPNDVLSGAQKLSGILLESKTIERQRFVVVGVGVNLKLPETMKSSFDRPVTDIRSLLGTEIEADVLAAHITLKLLNNIESFRKSAFSAFTAGWNARDAYIGQSVQIESSGLICRGKVQGVNERGELLLLTAKGVETIRAGEMMPSVRPIGLNWASG